MKNWVQQAREASGLSLEDCASALFLSRDAFAQKDANPGTITLNELRVLHNVFNEDARKIVQKVLLEIYLKDPMKHLFNG